MEWKKLAPWNWFRKEQEQGGQAVPARVGRAGGDPLAEIRVEMDRMMDAAFGRLGMGRWPGTEGEVLLRPSLDISESKKAYSVRVELPGAEKSDVQLTVRDDTLVIRGEKKREREESDVDYHCVERAYGAFERLLSLPDDADPDQIKARFKHGVLDLTIPKRATSEVESRTIEIQHD